MKFTAENNKIFLIVAGLLYLLVWNARDGQMMKRLPVYIIIILSLFISCYRQDLYQTVNKDIKTITGMQVTPPNLTVSITNTIQCSALLVFADNTTEDVTGKAAWSVSGSATQGVSPGSFVAGSSAGTATISATFRDFSTTASGLDSVITVSSDIFVSPLGNDATGTGTSSNPYATIEHALTIAAAGTNIIIAQGDYSPASQLTMSVDGVSLLGGYSTLWVNDLTGNRARIIDTSTTGTSPKAALQCGSAITSTTVIEGLEIYGSTVYTGTASAAINTAGKPTIRYCTLDGGKGATNSYGIYSTHTSSTMTIEYSDVYGGTGAVTGYGVYSTGSSGPILISYSNINGGTGTAGSNGIYIYDTGNSIIEFSTISGGAAPNSYGFYQPSIAYSSLIIMCSTVSGGTGMTSNTGMFFQNNAEPSPTVYNNIIITGNNPSGTITSTAILLGQASKPIIANNTISTGNTTTNAYGIYTGYGAQPYILNNIFLLPSGINRYGIYESGYAGDDPAMLKNNIFYNTTVIYHNYSTTVDWITIATMESGLTSEGSTIASGNGSIDPVIAGGSDYHLTAASPAIAKSGGLNGLDETTPAWLYFPTISSQPIDYDGNIRPASLIPWSIGAYQY
jgi:hypothetical protein